MCTLCSCYPWQVLGLSPSWYQDPAYRTGVVKEPRKVSPRRVWTWPRNVRTTVHDSSSEVRWLVLPERPAGTGGLSEEELIPLITRDVMVGGQNQGTMTAPIDIDGPAASPRSNGELVFAEPSESRAVRAESLYEAGLLVTCGHPVIACAERMVSGAGRVDPIAAVRA
jgi:hypothetical protein